MISTRGEIFRAVFRCNSFYFIISFIILMVITLEIRSRIKIHKKAICSGNDTSNTFNRNITKNIIIFMLVCMFLVINFYKIIVPIADVLFCDTVYFKGYCVSSTESIKSHDISIVLFDKSGKEVKLTTLNSHLNYLYEYDICYTKRSHILLSYKELNSGYFKDYLSDKTEKRLDKEYLEKFILQRN